MELQQAIKAMGDVFAGLAVREPQPRASEAFRVFGEQHRSMEKFGQDMVKKVKPVSEKKIVLAKIVFVLFRYWRIWVLICIRLSQILD